MKLIGTESGRVVLLFPIEEMRPLRGLVLAESVRLIAERYQFMYPPDLSSWENIEKGPLLFRSGKLERNGSAIALGELGIYRDGISVNAMSTEIAEEIMNDLFDWSKRTLGMRELQRLPRKSYYSTITVEFEHELGGLFSQYIRIVSLFSQSFNEAYNTQHEMALTRLGFSVDPTKVPQSSLVGEFVIERRVNYPYDAQRFFCSAPLPTDGHIRLLQQLENLIGSA
jgi:hypothetical protein